MIILVSILFFIYRNVVFGAIYFIFNTSLGLFQYYAYNNFLQDYHRRRIESLIFPNESDYLTVGYQLFQSKVAIGSGGIYGKGLGEGTQSYLRFLPIKDSDFILSVISEEMGLLSILIIVSVFLFLVYYRI